ncbi:MAG: hypothetical protein QT02_C0001G0099 [archaeon GW2011_AR9]|nr:MAG: hypothetical protein QT02_C0001G0099 [archaeon GW2011_AR9]
MLLNVSLAQMLVQLNTPALVVLQSEVLLQVR